MPGFPGLPAGPIEFEITWLGHGRGETIAVETITRIDLTAACRHAARQMTAGRGHGASAHGFHVQSKRGER